MMMIIVFAGNFNRQTQRFRGRRWRRRRLIAAGEINRPDQCEHKANRDHFAVRLEPVIALNGYLLLASLAALTPQRSR